MSRCGDCGAEEGQLHDFGCDVESCPFCGGQLISCNCCYEKLGYNYDWNKPFSGLPEEIYKNGLSEKENKKWLKILKEKGRVPWILYPQFCARCGEEWPEFFMVPDKEWEKYIQIDMRNKIICEKCYTEIKNLIDNAKI